MHREKQFYLARLKNTSPAEILYRFRELLFLQYTAKRLKTGDKLLTIPAADETQIKRLRPPDLFLIAGN